MKQETPSPSPNTSRFRPTLKAKDLPKDGGGNRAKSVPPDMKNNSSKVRRSLVLTKPKSGENSSGSLKSIKEAEEHKVPARAMVRTSPAAVVAEQFARLRRVRAVVDKGSGDGAAAADEKCKELKEKIEGNENLIKNLQDEVLQLKAELGKSQSLNVELESKNKKLSEDLAAAQTKIAALNSHDQKESAAGYQSPKFKDIQKLIARKLENPKVMKEAPSDAVLKTTQPLVPVSSAPKVGATAERKSPPSSSLPPPPPPPPLPSSRPRAKGAITPQKAPAIVEFYNLLTKQDGKRDQPRPGNANKSVATSVHNSIVGEIQNRSAHLMAIKADIETKGEFIDGLIKKIQGASYKDIEDVLKFVDWLDGELSSLADERAVLKHFNWPEKKADAMREAAVEYRSLKLLESEISSYKDDLTVPCGTALKKMANLLDKSERGIQRLTKLRSSVMRSYQDYKIPTDWMLDDGIVKRIKQASMKLAKMYMKRVTTEFESVRKSDREATQEALLLQGVHFAYRAHQFVGGLDSETLCAFEEIRQRVPSHLGGSQELFSGITSS